MERQSLRKKFNKMTPLSNTHESNILVVKDRKTNIEIDVIRLLHLQWNGPIPVLTPVEPPKKKTVATKEIRLKPEVRRNRDKLLKELMTSKLKRKKQLSHR